MIERSSCSWKPPANMKADEEQPVQVHSSKASHYVLVYVCLAVVRCCKWAQPGYREWVAKYHLQVHPFRLFGPSSLLLFQLLNALQCEEKNNCEYRSTKATSTISVSPEMGLDSGSQTASFPFFLSFHS